MELHNCFVQSLCWFYQIFSYPSPFLKVFWLLIAFLQCIVTFCFIRYKKLRMRLWNCVKWPRPNPISSRSRPVPTTRSPSRVLAVRDWQLCIGNSTSPTKGTRTASTTYALSAGWTTSGWPWTSTSGLWEGLEATKHI